MDINSNFAIQSTSSIIGKNINLFNQLSIEILTIIQKYEDNFIKDRNKLIGVGCPTASLIASFNINQSEQIRLQNIETEDFELIDLIVEKTNEFRKTIIKGNKDVKEKSEKKNQNAMQHEEDNTIDPSTMQSSSINDTVAQTQDYCIVLSPRLFSKTNQTQASINTSNQFIPTVSSTIANEEFFRPSASAVNENIFNSTVNNENEKLNETVVFKRPAAKPAAKPSKNLKNINKNQVDPSTMQSSSINDTVAQTQDYCNLLSPILFSKTNQTQASINTSNQFIPTVSSTIANEEFFRPSASAVNENIFNSTVNNENEKLNETVVFKKPAAKPAAKPSKNLKNINKNQVEYFKCDIDGQIFTSKIKLCKHMNNHLKAIDNNFQCKICSKMFKSAQCLRQHEKIHDKKFQCEICKCMQSSQSQLNQHIKLCHENTETYKCQTCKKEFRQKHHLADHQRTHDKNRPKPFKCHRCDFATDNKNWINKHQKFHERQDKKFAAMKNPLKCEKCPTFHRNKYSLNVHMKQVHPKNLLQCDLCAKFSKTRYDLLKHFKVHKIN